MTLRGLLVSFLELFLVVLALGTEIREFFVVALCVGGLMIYSLLSLALACLTFIVESSINKKAILRGESVKYTLTMYGVALLPVAAYLTIKTTEQKVKTRMKWRHSFTLVPSFKLEHKFNFKIPANHIGAWQIGIQKLRFEDVFGLFAFPILKLGKSDFATELLVMPKIHLITDDMDNISLGSFGTTATQCSEDGDLLSDSRLYKEGDSLKRINWKLSARTKTIYTRQYETPQKPLAKIVVDTVIKSDSVSDTADIICETAVSLARYFLAKNYIVEITALRCGKAKENRSYSLKNYDDVYKMQMDFALLDFGKSAQELMPTQREDFNVLSGERLFVISDNPSQQLLSDFTDLRKVGKSVTCFVPNLEFSDSKTFDKVRVDITSIEHIAEVVGDAL